MDKFGIATKYKFAYRCNTKIVTRFDTELKDHLKLYSHIEMGIAYLRWLVLSKMYVWCVHRRLTFEKFKSHRKSPTIVIVYWVVLTICLQHLENLIDSFRADVISIWNVKSPITSSAILLAINNYLAYNRVNDLLSGVSRIWLSLSSFCTCEARLFFFFTWLYSRFSRSMT